MEAYLASLFYYSDIKPEEVYIIIDKICDLYKYLLKKYNKCHWIEEAKSFDSTLKNKIYPIIDDDLILFGCDDVVYFRFFQKEAIADALLDNWDSVGFSLRLGRNIADIPDNISTDPMYFKWQWTTGQSHWGYPWELMSSFFRGHFVKKVIENNPNKFRNPNDLESFGVNYLMKNAIWPNLMMFNSNNYAVACDMNRVQDLYPNRYTGSEEQTPEKLKQAFANGYRLKWENLFNISPPDVFVGNKYFELVQHPLYKVSSNGS